MVFGTLARASAPAGSSGSTRRLRNALGMAFHQTSGSAQSMRDGVISKRLGAGFAARSAVLGAFLAADGLTGTRRTLEGNAGLFALTSATKCDRNCYRRAGTALAHSRYSFKPYPCCRCNHTPIGLGIKLHNQGVNQPTVGSAEIGMGNVNWLTVGEPYDARRDSVVHAQFNAAYSSRARSPSARRLAQLSETADQAIPPSSR